MPRGRLGVVGVRRAAAGHGSRARYIVTVLGLLGGACFSVSSVFTGR